MKRPSDAFAVFLFEEKREAVSVSMSWLEVPSSNVKLTVRKILGTETGCSKDTDLNNCGNYRYFKGSFYRYKKKKKKTRPSRPEMLSGRSDR